MPTNPGIRHGFFVLLALVTAACDRSGDSQAAGQGSASASPATASLAPTSTAPPAPRSAFGALVSKLDARIARLEKRAGERKDDWLHLDELARAYLERAKLSGDFRDYQKAERAIEEAMKRAPAGSGPLLTRASLNYTLHRLDRVEADLAAVERFAVVRPDERRAVASLRADVAFHSGRYDEAKMAYEAILAEKRTPSGLAALAQYHWKTGDLEQAATLLEEAEAASNGSSDATRAWIALVRGLLELDRNELDAALAHYRRAQQHLPGYWLLEEHVAEVLAKKGDVEEALAIYLDVIARTQNPELMDAAADLHAQQGDEAEAKALRQKARAGHDARLKQYPEAAAGHALDHYLQHDPARGLELAEQNHRVRPSGEAKTKLAQAYLAAVRVADARRIIEATLATVWRTAELHATASLVFAAAGDEGRAESERARAEALAAGAMDDVAWLKPPTKE